MVTGAETLLERVTAANPVAVTLEDLRGIRGLAGAELRNGIQLVVE
jgi:hypothetical protein